MPKKISVIQWLAWFYFANFLFIVVLSHWPGLTDTQGRLLGLYTIDPIDDIFHLISAILAATVALRSRAWSVNYFKYAGLPYLVDGITGLFGSVEFLNGDIFRQGWGKMDFSQHNFLNNLPHLLIPGTMLTIGYGVARKFK